MEELVTEFNGKLAEGLKIGQYFEIDVTTATNPKRFNITLADNKLNTHPDAKKILHVEVRFNEFRIVASSPSGDIHNYSSDFYTWDNDIKVIIMICDRTFHISVNGDHELKLAYPDNTIHNFNAIQIAGDIKSIKRMDHRKIYPIVWPPSSCIPYYKDEMYFSNDIPVRFKPGHLMVITARCYGAPTGNFYINMKHAHNETLLMHVSVDFRDKTVYRCHLDPISKYFFAHEFSENSTDGGFPFDFNRPFKIGIACQKDKFLIAINGLYFCSYAYTDPENRQFRATAPRPYKDVLSNIVGIKVFSRNGAGIKVTEVDHILLDNPECTTFENYTKNEYDPPKEMDECRK